jgi:hypothetical protein
MKNLTSGTGMLTTFQLKTFHNLASYLHVRVKIKTKNYIEFYLSFYMYETQTEGFWEADDKENIYS